MCVCAFQRTGIRLLNGVKSFKIQTLSFLEYKAISLCLYTRVFVSVYASMHTCVSVCVCAFQCTGIRLWY